MWMPTLGFFYDRASKFRCLTGTVYGHQQSRGEGHAYINRVERTSGSPPAENGTTAGRRCSLAALDEPLYGVVVI